VFEANESTGSGGAVCVLGGVVELRRAEFAMNSAGASAGTGGGALHARGGEVSVSDALFYDNVSVDEAGAVLLETDAAASFINCTWSANRTEQGSAGAIYNRDSMLQVTNGILWDNQPEQIRQRGRASNVVRYSTVMGGAAGSGNLALDPRFVNAMERDYRLMADSPCIDAGLGTGASTRDLAGNPRTDLAIVLDSGSGNPAYVDLGALEYQP
jgi:hypothetical protein